MIFIFIYSFIHKIYKLAYILAHQSVVSALWAAVSALWAAVPVVFLNSRFKSPTDDTPIRIQDCV